MYNFIERFVIKMTKEDINNFAISKGIDLSEEELNFTYDFVKKNYKTFLGNPNLFNIERYSNYYQKENFSKITKVYNEYIKKYANYL